MSVVLGSYQPSETVRFWFSTGDGSGGRVAFSDALEEGDIVIVKDGAVMTLDASTITVGVFNSDTGMYEVEVDMSNDTDFTWGARYFAYLHPDTETIDSQNPAAPLAYWDTFAPAGLEGTFSGTHTSTTSDLGANAPSNDVTGMTLYNPTDVESRVIRAYNTGTGVATHAAWDTGTGVTDGEPWRLIPTAPIDSVTLAAIQAELEEDGASILDTLRDRLTSARATALDEITAARLEELDAANIPADIDTALSRLTSARAGYLDNLNIGELVAGTSEVTAIQNNTRVVRVVPDVIERETRTYRVELFLYDSEGNMEAPDAAPTIELVDQDGTDLSARLDSTTMTLVETGRYRAVYTSDAAHDTEQLLWVFSVVEGGATRKYGNRSIIVDTIAVDFTAADRTKLEAINSAATEARLAELDAANLPADLDAVLADTGELVGDWEDGGRLDLLLDGLVAQIDTARGEPGQGAPPVSAKIAEKIDYLYKFLRNKSEQTSSEHKVYDDAGTTVDHKRTVSDDGTTFSAGEVATGP